jgi:TRAP-type mannitol/chloroaromatic compound transport system permease small subunit
VLHQSKGAAVEPAARDLRLPELVFLVPLVVCLIFLSAWPAAVTDHTFGQTSQTPGLVQLR